MSGPAAPLFDVAALAPLREIVRASGHGADKRLGQHFLVDPSILRRIVAAAEPLEAANVLEVGPGPGGLTRALLERPLRLLVAIERDSRWVEALQPVARAAAGRLEILNGDALSVGLNTLSLGPPVTIVANLPYNVGTELLVGWLAAIDQVRLMVLMFQKEVALRLVATPGTADWGRLAVLAQSVCRVERLFDLPGAAFVPPPRVASSVVRLAPRADRPDARHLAAIQAVTRAAFGQRRKMLRASLRTLLPNPEQLLRRAGIDPTRRAETLTLDELWRLASLWR